MKPVIELKPGQKGKFFFNLKAGNGEIIFTSQMYATKPDALAGIASLKTHAHDDSRFERKVAKNDSPYFVLKAVNGETIGRSETYASPSSMEHGLESVKRNAATAETRDLTEIEAEAPV
ncbi:MAG TPA: YegP family protein [Gemmatimonadaceae bacterium]|nr:YegP family protein [Gemmatimonadaceae bacterium]